MINDINVQQVKKNRHPRQTFTQCVRVIPSCNITFKQFLVGGFPRFEGRPWKSHVGNALTPLSLARIRNYPGYLINLNEKRIHCLEQHRKKERDQWDKVSLTFLVVMNHRNVILG